MVNVDGGSLLRHTIEYTADETFSSYYTRAALSLVAHGYDAVCFILSVYEDSREEVKVSR
jgi:hypothetical protein